MIPVIDTPPPETVTCVVTKGNVFRVTSRLPITRLPSPRTVTAGAPGRRVNIVVTLLVLPSRSRPVTRNSYFWVIAGSTGRSSSGTHSDGSMPTTPAPAALAPSVAGLTVAELTIRNASGGPISTVLRTSNVAWVMSHVPSAFGLTRIASSGDNAPIVCPSLGVATRNSGAVVSTTRLSGVDSSDWLPKSSTVTTVYVAVASAVNVRVGKVNP